MLVCWLWRHVTWGLSSTMCFWLAQKSIKKINQTTKMMFGLSISFSAILHRGRK
jgi:hypothetical protein